MPLTKKEIFDGLKEAKLNKLKAKSPLFRESPQPSPIREIPTDIPRQSLASPSDLVPRKTESLRDRFSSVKNIAKYALPLVTQHVPVVSAWKAAKFTGKAAIELFDTFDKAGAHALGAAGFLALGTTLAAQSKIKGTEANKQKLTVGDSFSKAYDAWADLAVEIGHPLEDIISPGKPKGKGLGAFSERMAEPIVEQFNDEKDTKKKILRVAELTGLGAAQLMGNPFFAFGITGAFKGSFTLSKEMRGLVVQGLMNSKEGAALEALGLKRGATVEEINKAYRVLAHKYHPDKIGDSTMMTAINNARDSLLKGTKFVPTVTPARGTEPVRGVTPVRGTIDPSRGNLLPTPRAQLPIGTGSPVIPPQPLNTQAEFQILAPNKAKQITTLQNKLEKIIALKEKLVSSDKATSKDVSAVKGLREIINGLESEISTARGQRVTATGPIRTTPRTVTVPPKPKAPVKTATIKPTPKVKTITTPKKAPVTPTTRPTLKETVELTNILRGTKGLSAKDIITKHPDINLKKDVSITDIHGNKDIVPKGEALTPYELKDGKILLQDGETYLVSKNQFQNIKGQSKVAEAKEFAPVLKGTKEIIKKDDEATFIEHTLISGTNYKEILIQLPITNKKNAFQGNHFPDLNIVSFPRLTEHKWNGKTVKLLEELQSDWQIAIRKATDILQKARNMSKAEALAYIKSNKNTGKKVSYKIEGIQKIVKIPPYNPIVDQHVELGLQRSLLDAVESNADYFAWITGEQTTARYNLATKVESIDWNIKDKGQKEIRLLKNKFSNPIIFNIDKSGQITKGDDMMPPDWKGEGLDEVIGKGLADNIMSSDKGKLSGKELEFGGEWAINLYNKQIPNVVKDLTGAKIETLDMGLPVEHSIKMYVKDSKNKGATDSKSKGAIVVTQNNIKVGDEVIEQFADDLQIENALFQPPFSEFVGRGDDVYTVTKILKNGRFEGKLTSKLGESDTAIYKKVFNLAIKTTTQQGIKLTPEIKAIIKSEAPTIKKPSGLLIEPISTPTLFHGGFRGQLKVDKLGNINLGTSKTDIEKFGDAMTFDTSKMKVLEFPTKSAMFDAAANKQKYINKGIDVLISGNHAIAIRPQKFAKAVGKPFVKLGERTVAAEIKRTTPKKAIGRPVTGGISQLEALKRKSEKKKTGEVSIVDKLKAQTKELEKARVEAQKILVKEAKRDLKEVKRTAAGEVTTRKMSAEEKKKFGIDTTKTVTIDKFNPTAYKKELLAMKNKGATISTFERLYTSEFKKESESDQALVDNKSDIILEFIEENFARKMTAEEKVAFDDGVLESTRRRRTSDFVDKYEGEAQPIPKQTDTALGDFILSKKAEEVLDFFKLRYGERGLTKRQLGVYKPLSDKVRVRSLSDISTVTHEVVHGLDKQHKIVASLVGLKSPVKAALKSVYLKTYPKAKITDPEIKQYTEGLSVFIENYFYDPAGMAEQYPVLIDNFIKPDGKFYNSDITLLLEKMNTIVDEYAQLTPDERIGAHIRRGDEIVKKQNGFNISQRLVFELFNKFEPLKRYAKKAGVFETWADPTIQAFNWMNTNSIVAEWVQGKATPILKTDGNYLFPKGTVKDYLEMVGLRDKEFDSYLVARRVVSDNNKLVALHNRQQKTKAEISKLQKVKEPSKEIKKEKTKQEKSLKAIDDDMSVVLDIIESDDFRLQDATAVVDKYDNIFKAPALLYDIINNRLLQFSYNTGLITKEQFTTWTNDEGYTSFRRFINDELASGNVGTMGVSPNIKVSSFKKRKGSALDIVSPVYNQRVAIHEVISKGMENVLWNKVADLTLNDKEIASRFEEIETMVSVSRDGRISYPQERDPNTIPVLRDGKKKFYKAAPEFLAVAKSMRPMELGAFATIIRIPSATMTRLTTSANPWFTFSNISMDVFATLMNTKYGYKITDVPSGLVDNIKQTDEVTQYLALGGKRQTLASFYELSPEAFNKALTSDKKTKVESVVQVTESTLGLAEIPSNYSEIIIREREFDKGLNAGRSHSEAMYDASQVTTPFQLTGNMFGPLGRVYLRSIPYFAAGIQVLYKQANAIKANPKRVATVYAGVLTTATSLAIAIMMYASDKQKREFKKLQVHELSSGMYIPSPTGSGLIKIRIPQQIGALVGMAQLYIITKFDGNKATMREYLESMTSFLPEQFDIMNPSAIPTKLLPQLFKPSVEVTLNKRTFPEIAPIVPPYMEALPSEEQYSAYTSRVAKSIGQLLGISPAKVDFYVREQFGVIGGLMLLKRPKFPLWRQEEEFKVAGRAVSRFYDNYNTLETQYQRSQNPDNTYSIKEQTNISMLRDIYIDVNNLLGIQRDIYAEEMPLSENAKQATFDLLISLDEVTLADYDTNNKIQEIMIKLGALQLDIRTIMLDVHPKDARRINEEIFDRYKKDTE